MTWHSLNQYIHLLVLEFRLATLQLDGDLSPDDPAAFPFVHVLHGPIPGDLFLLLMEFCKDKGKLLFFHMDKPASGVKVNLVSSWWKSASVRASRAKTPKTASAVHLPVMVLQHRIRSGDCWISFDTATKSTSGREFYVRKHAIHSMDPLWLFAPFIAVFIQNPFLLLVRFWLNTDLHSFKCIQPNSCVVGLQWSAFYLPIKLSVVFCLNKTILE